MFMIHDRARDLLAFFAHDPGPDGYAGAVLPGAYLEPGAAGGTVVGVAAGRTRYRVFVSEAECVAAGYEPVAGRAVYFERWADFVAWLAWLEEPAAVLRAAPRRRTPNG